MKAFGIEIRKAGISAIYKDVDAVLKKNGINHPGEVSGEVQMATIAHSLQKMMQADSWFDVCTIDSCIRVTNLHIQSDRYNIYRAIHCVHWRDMIPEYRETIMAMILDDFRPILNPHNL